MPITDEMLLPARCFLAIEGKRPTSLRPGDKVMFGLNPQKGVEGPPRFLRGENELELTVYHANGCTSSGVSSLLNLCRCKPDGPTEHHAQAMAFAEFIASLLGYGLELVEKNAHRIIFRFL